MRVLVPFRRREAVGCVDRLARETDLDRVREVREVLDREPFLPEPLLRLCRWTAEYYVAPLGLVLRTAVPPGVFTESGYRISLVAGDDPLAGSGDGEEPGEAETEDRTERALAVLRRLREASGPLRATTLREAAGGGSVWPILRSLEEEGLVRIREEAPKTGASRRRQQTIRLVRELPTLLGREEAFGRADRQREAYETLEAIGGSALVTHMVKRQGFSRSVLRGLEDRGIAEISAEPLERDPFAEFEAPPPPDLEPTGAQREVIGALLERARRAEAGVALLRGVTGSGKTFVYLRVLERIVQETGAGAIVLVPEISLTPQTVERFRAVFGDLVAVLHSGLSQGERHDQWRALREGRKRIAVGARSAIFAPVRDLGLVIVDEEHEGSYKQSDTPRYHARALAAVRAGMEGALCVLGSATPSLESWQNAREGRYALLELPERVTGHPLPEVELVDLREERQRRRNLSVSRTGPPPRLPEAGPVVFTEPLHRALSETLERGEQAILLLNRRGYSSFVQCRECGHVRSCRRCSVSLTYHRRRNRIVCHHCGHQEPVPEGCGECGADGLSFSGVGTEQVERRVGELFPGARLARMDVDTTGTKWAHFEILDRVRDGEVDVLLGTQMIAKGLDFPGVTLVGVVNADVGLNLPDFRAAERTFQLIAQVAGRAGRGDRAGRVLVQTARPDHFALRAAAEHDYLRFAGRETADREAPGYPPHLRLANLLYTGPGEERVAGAAVELGEWLRELIEEREIRGLRVVGPAPCAIERVRSRWRWHLLLKAEEPAILGSVLRYLSHRHGQPGGDLRLEIDRDPESLL